MIGKAAGAPAKGHQADHSEYRRRAKGKVRFIGAVLDSKRID